MLTEEEKRERCARFLAGVDRLMAPGVRLAPRDRAWCIQKREAFHDLDEVRVPGDQELGRLRRLLANVGLAPRRKFGAPSKAADHHPDASTPAGLQGSRAATPMPAWLITGQGLPLRPPTRRAVPA